MRYTIYDLAKLANCSVSTVSKALNNKDDVGEKTRQKILKIAKEVNYVPSASARATAQNKSYLIGVLLFDDFNLGITHPLFGPVIQSFSSYVAQMGYDVVLMRNLASEGSAGFVDYINYRNLDGVFVPVYDHLDKLNKIIDTKVPLVGMDMDSSFNLPIVVSDNNAGIEIALEYLFKLGHTKIANIAANIKNNYIARLRENLFKEKMAELNLKIPKHFLLKSRSFGFDDAYFVTKTMLLENKGNLPTAIFANADIMALGAMKAIKELGYQIPYDISVIGFDDIEMSAISTPKLTTVSQNKVDLGICAARVLLDQIGGQSVAKRNYVDVKLIKRESVAKIS
ncbi:MAG: LacI family DNA-binding transcriptional regulator [Erysipelotrichaceae bacterium]